MHLFSRALDRKSDKARKWIDRAVTLDPDLGDSWARFFAFELGAGTEEQQTIVKERCVAAEPKHGELWTSVSKNIRNRGTPFADILDIAADKVIAESK